MGSFAVDDTEWVHVRETTANLISWRAPDHGLVDVHSDVQSTLYYAHRWAAALAALEEMDEEFGDAGRASISWTGPPDAWPRVWAHATADDEWRHSILCAMEIVEPSPHEAKMLRDLHMLRERPELADRVRRMCRYRAGIVIARHYLGLPINS